MRALDVKRKILTCDDAFRLAEFLDATVATRFSRFHSDRIFHMHGNIVRANIYARELQGKLSFVEGRDRSMRSRRFARKLRPEISQRGQKMGRRETTNVAFNDNSCENSIGNFIIFFFLFGVFDSSLGRSIV